MAILLVGPSGQKFLLMYHNGAGTDAVSANLTFDDSASTILSSSAITSGTYKPSTYSSGTYTFPSPAPSRSSSSPYLSGALSIFNGANPTGAWSLYVRDDSAVDSGSISGGWSLSFTMAPPTTATVTLNNLAQTYDGNPKSVSASTSPTITGTVSLTYNGSPTAPTDAGYYSVVGTIVNDLIYTGSSTGTLTVTGWSSNWRNSYFGTTVNSGTAADTANPDGDGLTNVQEYVFGSNPTIPDAGNLLTIGRSGSNTTLSFTAKSAGSGAGYNGLTRHYAVETTTDLTNSGSWTAVTGYSSIQGANQTSDIVGTDQTVTITLPTSGTNSFYRLKARL